MDNNIKEEFLKRREEGRLKRERNKREPQKTIRESFLKACIAGDDKLVKQLLPIVDDIPENSLKYAAESGNITLVEALLEAGVNVYLYGYNALLTATEKEYIEIAKLLIEKGADVNGIRGKSEPLIIAVKKKNIEIAKVLLQNGANVHVNDDSPLVIAVCNNDIDMINLLLEYGANIHVVRDDAISIVPLEDFPIRHAVNNGYLKTVELLIKKGANLNITGGIYGNLLLEALCVGNVEMARLLFQNGIKYLPNEFAINQLLTKAVRRKDMHLARFLITELGADIRLFRESVDLYTASLLLEDWQSK